MQRNTRESSHFSRCLCHLFIWGKASPSLKTLPGRVLHQNSWARMLGGKPSTWRNPTTHTSRKLCTDISGTNMLYTNTICWTSDIWQPVIGFAACVCVNVGRWAIAGVSFAQLTGFPSTARSTLPETQTSNSRLLAPRGSLDDRLKSNVFEWRRKKELPESGHFFLL